MTNRDDANFFSNEGYGENFDDDEEENENIHEEQENFLNKNEALYALELEHLDNRLIKETNKSILELSIRIAENSWFWKWKSVEKRVKTILTIYYDLFEHVNFDPNNLD